MYEKKFGYSDLRVEPERRFSSGPSAAPSAKVDENIESVIGQELRALYGDVLSEPVPQRFVDLLENLVNEADQ